MTTYLVQTTSDHLRIAYQSCRGSFTITNLSFSLTAVACFVCCSAALVERLMCCQSPVFSLNYDYKIDYNNNKDNIFNCLMAVRSTVYGRPSTAILTSSLCAIYAACKNGCRSVPLAKAATPLSSCFQWVHTTSIHHRWLATPNAPQLIIAKPCQPVH